MKIVSYYNGSKMPLALSNLTGHGKVVDFEDVIEDIKFSKDIIPKLEELYRQRVIHETPVEVTSRADMHRVKLVDAMGNNHYLMLKE